MDVEVVRKSRGIDPKERKPRSTAQLPVYREASRLAYVLFRVLKTSPRKMTKMWDESMAIANAYALNKAMLTDEWYRYFILANNIKVKAKQKVWKQ